MPFAVCLWAEGDGGFHALDKDRGNGKRCGLAEYEYIELTEKGWYLAAEEGEYFYLDEQGSRIDMPDTADGVVLYGDLFVITQGDENKALF